jgi:uncharacterized RDD family membrane protein YckC
VQPYFPAHVAVVRDPTDVIGRRIAALVIDWAIAFVMIVALAVSLESSREFLFAEAAENACDQINEIGDEFCLPLDNTIYVYDWSDVAVIFLLPLAYHFLNDGLLTGVTGFSIGKGLVGLRVIRMSDGRLCGVGRALLRWLLWAADGAPYCLPIVALVTGLSTKGHRRVGDIAAGTLVVDKRDVGVVPVIPGLNAMTPPPWPASTWGAPPPAWGSPPPAWGSPQAMPPPPVQAQPAPPPPPPPPPTVARPQTNPGIDSPLWDEARDTYIQWDADLSTWVQWDDSTKEWHPIT